MSPERSRAYSRVVYMLAELGPSKLQLSEQDRIRYTADSLIFCAEIGRDEATREALEDIELLLELLVESGRWERATAEQLICSLRECGPALPAEFSRAEFSLAA